MPGTVKPGASSVSLESRIMAVWSMPTARPPCHSWIPALPPSAWMASVSSFSLGMYLSSAMERNILGALSAWTEDTSTIFSALPPLARATWYAMCFSFTKRSSVKRVPIAGMMMRLRRVMSLMVMGVNSLSNISSLLLNPCFRCFQDTTHRRGLYTKIENCLSIFGTAAALQPKR